MLARMVGRFVFVPNVQRRVYKIQMKTVRHFVSHMKGPKGEDIDLDDDIHFGNKIDELQASQDKNIEKTNRSKQVGKHQFFNSLEDSEEFDDSFKDFLKNKQKALEKSEQSQPYIASYPELPSPRRGPPKQEEEEFVAELGTEKDDDEDYYDYFITQQLKGNQEVQDVKPRSRPTRAQRGGRKKTYTYTDQYNRKFEEDVPPEPEKSLEAPKMKKDSDLSEVAPKKTNKKLNPTLDGMRQDLLPVGGPLPTRSFLEALSQDKSKKISKREDFAQAGVDFTESLEKPARNKTYRYYSKKRPQLKKFTPEDK